MLTQTSVSAGGVVFDEEGRVVLTSRRSFKGVLQWGLPKGLVEEGETISEAAGREATEETGLEVRVLAQLRTIDYWYVQPSFGDLPATRVHKFVHFFLMLAVGGDTGHHDQETEQVVALPPDEAVATCTFPSEAEVITLAVEVLAQRPQR